MRVLDFAACLALCLGGCKSPNPPAATAASAPSPHRLDVWIDVDTAAGLPSKDIDDAVALIQAFNSPELNVVGVSAVFGNASLEDGLPITQEIVRRFGPPNLKVFAGAASAGLTATDASRALASALRERPLTILALGPVSNVATVLKHDPELAGRITRLVAVAGRRPGQRFTTGNTERRGHRDFNFEKDPEAMRVLATSNIKLSLAPWELSSKVWITERELAMWRQGSEASQWLAAAAPSWLRLWQDRFAVDGFNPFDTLAVAILTHPSMLECERMSVGIEVAANDVPDPLDRAEGRADKPYLVVGRQETSHTVDYCFDVDRRWKAELVKSITREAATGITAPR